ncbi:hypothetical protein RhiirA4_480086 [Rhizophagus irregularis]|uniref:Protein kinase domain-containing protein n=1 Tax=Rhizophagus irregularis TaxID=588596 RepID=A0A2I1HHJ1_9GLOM|nr:hypothetical protein RhiirA4_480086 [Rhizophagus irregularis]
MLDYGSLQFYLKENSNKLGWNNKYRLYTFALVHQNRIKLEDFGISRKITDISYNQADFLGVVPLC